MDKKEEDASIKPDEKKAFEKSSEKRMEILHSVDAGEMDVSEAIKQLQGQEEPEEKMDILNQLEQGHIDVEEALHRLDQEEGDSTYTSSSSEHSTSPYGTTEASAKWRDWWLLILASSLALIAFTGWLGTIGGWWWLCAGPGLIIGLVLFVVAMASKNAPWLHLRVDTGQKTWPRHIVMSFPLPVSLASWGLKTWGSRIPGLNNTVVDDLIIAMEGNLSKENPIYIDVQEDESTGERVQIYLG